LVYLRPFGIRYGNMDRLRVFGIFSPFWYVWTNKNLATLIAAEKFLRPMLYQSILDELCTYNTGNYTVFTIAVYTTKVLGGCYDYNLDRFFIKLGKKAQ
jgi:hypothetical protein